ncbi:hypothetical protein E5Q53_10075 [Haemophilus parahaemolyticus]|uniref:Uncharacterized protein n=2 Tax=Haemophilus parahaemolyticus TaxID=735 RepID=A0AAE6JSN1_HAEPH|nr:hypothetical protein [Haemophilus parahaemolyticus]EIJ72961.1 hypothetical protein HMPREF1050_0008 [Haemophilus parahaemolyticus HK385]OOR97561.1 hypothetical protein B0185_01785 [Haemophilus parahaemolyticus]QEN11738.1 hypothetical protein E5Q53_10075 [Haemophilus parahaemolyticus]QRP12935.1 hypothetical protein I6J29_01870 [Haemophilus parahaemolyticus]STO66227.1 Uncharacterised protein [Haemophilus parahaemolyticus HK385]
MAILIVMLILILGYYYSSNYLPERFKLKRSSGWESYVLLGSHGVKFVIRGIIFTLVVFGFLYIVSVLLNVPIYLGFHYQRFSLEDYLITDILEIKVYYLLITLGALLACRTELNQKKLDTSQIYQEMSSANNIVNLLFSAMNSQIPVKVSLKSKKVYVGIVDGTQFSSADLENIVIIPYLSGYRHKDQLNIIFDCNYLSVYQKYNISHTESEDKLNLKYFRNVIRVSEIESISLFDMKYFDDFERINAEKTE